MASIDVSSHCYFCGTESEGAAAETVLRVDGDPIAPSKGIAVKMSPCPHCKDIMSRSILVIIIDETRSEPGWLTKEHPSPCRTGMMYAIGDEYFKKTLKPGPALDGALLRRFIFMDIRLAIKMSIVKSPEQTNIESPE